MREHNSLGGDIGSLHFECKLTFNELLLCGRHCAQDFTYTMSLTPPSSLGSTTALLQTGSNLRPGSVSRLAQGHTAIKGQRIGARPLHHCVQWRSLDDETVIEKGLPKVGYFSKEPRYTLVTLGKN